jgi:hypothetical protein
VFKDRLAINKIIQRTRNNSATTATNNNLKKEKEEEKNQPKCTILL